VSRLSSLLAVLATLAAAAAGGEIPPHPSLLRFPGEVFAPPEARELRTELPSGAVVFALRDPSLPLIDVSVALRIGSFLDPPGQTGLASLTGALVRRGGAEGLPADELDERVARLGARLDSSTGLRRGGASLAVTSATLEEGLELLFSALREPAFEPARIEVALAGLSENMRRRNESPLDVLEREWEWLLLGRDHYSTRPVTPVTLDAIGRDDLVRFHRRHWRPEAMVFAISGDLRKERLMPLLERHLGAWPGAAETGAAETDTAEPAAWPPPFPTHRPKPGLYHAEADTPQAKVALGHLAPTAGERDEPQSAALRLMGEILGGSGAISRLGGRLRTAEGLVYRATSRFEVVDDYRGDFRIFFDTESRNVARALAAALSELERLRRDLVHPKELEVARETLIAGYRLRFDTAEEVVGYFAEDELTGRDPAHWRREVAALATVTPEAVRSAARAFLRPDDLVCLVVGRASEIGYGDEQRRAALEKVCGGLTELPRRDPLSLEPLDADRAQ
jgi:predicted Zn-dependent peptidase